MSKSAKSASAKKPAIASSAKPALAVKPAQPGSAANVQKTGSASKQSRVIATLQSPSGATIASMMKATGWQQHSVRGFLAGVVRKRLKLRLESKKVEGTRVYQIAGGAGGKSARPGSKRRPS